MTFKTSIESGLDASHFALSGNPPQMVRAVATQLIPVTTGVPDLSTLVAARRDLARARTSTPVTADISNLEPWASGAHIFAVGAQADLWQDLYASRPAVGATSVRAQFDWQSGPRLPGLPDPDQGDVVLWYQSGYTSGSAQRNVPFPRRGVARERDGWVRS